MTSDDAKKRLPEVERELAAATAHWRQLTAIRDELERDLGKLDRHRSHHEWRESGVIREALGQLARGVVAADGYSFPVMGDLVGKPGLTQTKQTITKLTAEQDLLNAFLLRWPEATTSHPYRYTGPKWKCSIDGKDVQPGDVVQLSATQVESWGDLFEAVAEEEFVG